MQIIQQLPHPALSPYVQCYWEIRREVAADTTLKVPFGCSGRTHWMIMLESTFQSGYDQGGPLAVHTSTLIGQITQPITHHISTTMCALLVNFTATGLYALWPLPVQELYGQNFETGPVLGMATHQVAEQLLNTPDQKERFALLDKYLLRRLRQVMPHTDGRVQAAVRQIQQRPGFTSIRELARYLNCTERTLNRRFTEVVGVSPKLYARVQRFLQTLRWLNQQEQHSDWHWHDFVVAAGYYDQSHLINEFKAFTGRSPQLYGVDHKPLSDVLRQE